MSENTKERVAKFGLDNMIYRPNAGRSSYEVGVHADISNVHWGNRKLVIDMVRFFSLFWPPTGVNNIQVVYVGAAHGIHIPLLVEMFPTFTFHLYDPFCFDDSVFEAAERTGRIFVHTGEDGFFTDELAAKWRYMPDSDTPRKDVLFISDIRGKTIDLDPKTPILFFAKTNIEEAKKLLESSSRYAEREREKKELVIIMQRDNISMREAAIRRNKEEIRIAEERYGITLGEAEKLRDTYIEDVVINDMKSQQRWVEIIQPLQALLKFRLPYPKNERDDRKFEYLHGWVFVQPWMTRYGSECRLVPIKNEKGEYKRVEWSILDFDRFIAYHNKVERRFDRFYNPFTGDLTPIDGDELLNDYDSTAEAYILYHYLYVTGVDRPTWDQVIQLSRTITTTIGGRANKKLADFRKNVKTPVSQMIGGSTVSTTLDPISSNAWKSEDDVVAGFTGVSIHGAVAPPGTPSTPMQNVSTPDKGKGPALPTVAVSEMPSLDAAGIFGALTRIKPLSPLQPSVPPMPLQPLAPLVPLATEMQNVAMGNQEESSSSNVSMEQFTVPAQTSIVPPTALQPFPSFPPLAPVAPLTIPLNAPVTVTTPQPQQASLPRGYGNVSPLQQNGQPYTPPPAKPLPFGATLPGLNPLPFGATLPGLNPLPFGTALPGANQTPFGVTPPATNPFGIPNILPPVAPLGTLPGMPVTTIPPVTNTPVLGTLPGANASSFGNPLPTVAPVPFHNFAPPTQQLPTQQSPFQQLSLPGSLPQPQLPQLPR